MKKIKGKLVDSISLEGKVDIYFKLMNLGFSDEYNSYKNYEVKETYYVDGLNFNWTICKVKVERCSWELELYLAIREYGCRGSYGFVVLESSKGKDMTIMEIDSEGGYYKVTPNELGYEMTNLSLCEDYVKILKSIKDKKLKGLE